MDIAGGIVVYLITWWIVLFMVLPWGNRFPENPEPGHAESAPVQPRLFLKATITTVLAAIIWVIIYFVIDLGLVELRPQNPWDFGKPS